MTSRQGDGYNNVLPTRIRNTMHARNMKIRDLADKTGISRQSIGYYADGSNVPDAEKLALIAKALDVSADYLIGLADTEKSGNNICLYTCAEAIEYLDRLMNDLGNEATYTIEEGELVYDPSYAKDYPAPSQLVIRISNDCIRNYFSEIQRMNNFFEGLPDSLKETSKEYKERIRSNLLAEAEKFTLELPF